MVETTVEPVQISDEDEAMQDIGSIFKTEVIGEQNLSQEVALKNRGCSFTKYNCFSRFIFNLCVEDWNR